MDLRSVKDGDEDKTAVTCPACSARRQLEQNKARRLITTMKQTAIYCGIGTGIIIFFWQMFVLLSNVSFPNDPSSHLMHGLVAFPICAMISAVIQFGIYLGFKFDD